MPRIGALPYREGGSPVTLAERRLDALRAHPFEPSDDLTRKDAAGRPMRTCRVCGRTGRGSGHRLHGLRPGPPELNGHRRDPTRQARAAREPAPVVERPGRHAFQLAPDGRRVVDTAGHSWAVCAECGKDRRSHPRRSPTPRQDAAQAPQLALVASAGQSNGSAAPAPSHTPRRAASKLPAAELVGLAIALDRVLGLPIDLVGWRLRMRLADVRALLTIPEYPTLDVAELPGEVDPTPPTPTQVERHPQLAPRVQAPTVDTATQALIRGIRDDRVTALARRAYQAGARLSMTGSGHLAIDAGGQRLVVSTTMSSGRRGHSWGNVRAAAKRAGIDVTGL
jgi:hypothetical protein